VGPEVVVVVVIFIVLVLIATTGWSRRSGGSTAGHYEPDAIGEYTLDPATMRYRYDLPSMPPSTSVTESGVGPPHRTRRRRKRPPDSAE
jgi:hypothetical protein